MWFYHEVETRAQGRLKFQYYFSGSMLPARETLSGLRAGVADIAVLIPEYHPGKVPLMTVTSLPAIARYYYSTAMAMPEFLNSPELKAEMDRYNVKYLSHAQTSSYAIWSKTPVNSIGDLRGMKVSATGWHARLVKELDAVPVSIVSQEVYTALQRGTVDAAVANPTYGTDRKFYEVCPHFYGLYIGTKALFVAVNKQSWEKIPADIRQIFQELQEDAVIAGREIYVGSGARKLAELKASGSVTVVEPSIEDVRYVREVAEKTVWRDWVVKMNHRGVPGQQVLDRWIDCTKRWDERDPFKD
jgi:TRAP-type C4-dicarboxylate transport system substrate-binding protein